MGFLTSRLGPRKSGDGTLELFRDIYGDRLSKSGESVTWKTALQVTTAFACGRVIGNGLAQVPLKIMRESGGKREPAREHPLYRKLYRKPNEWQTSFEYRETIGLHLVFVGKHYSFINRVRGQIYELIPLEPQYVEVKCAADGTLTYLVGSERGAVQEFPASAIWHLKGPSWNGWQGLEPVKLAREALGLSIATEAQHASMHANGVSMPGVYSVEGELDEKQYKHLRKFIKENHTGANQGLPMILDRGAKWMQLAMTGVDAQHLETRRFQVEEVCRAMGVMPIMVYSSDKAATYASAEQMFLAHVVHTMSPWYERLEQSIDVNLLTEQDAEAGYYSKFVVQALLRGAQKDRSESYAKALGAGGSPAYMTPDEVRELEDLNPMGGDAAVLPKPTNVGGTPKPPSEPPPDDPAPQGA